METSDGGGMGGVCSVGTIVWVRRRNGSWWPGRILGLHELSASHLMSPRSGTPVKLLGREDASVDWYNLEKSKRVKEFRCGEFDAFIERAETSQSIPTRKREKYARREDAILHALELEKQQRLDYTLNGISSKINGGPKSESVILSSAENFIRHNEPVVHGKLSSRKYESFLKNVVFSHDGKDIDDPLYLYEGIGNKKFSLEHNAEAVHRMRGLQDFGLRTSQSKRKPSISTGWENTHKSIDNHTESFSRSDNIIEEADQPSTSGNVVSFKRKRSCGGAINEFFVKKRDRRRPLVQVLQSSEKLPPPCSLQPSCGVIGTLNTQESEKAGSTWKAKRSRCVYLREDLEDQPDHVGYISEYVQQSANQFEICNDVSYSGNICEGYNSSCLIEMNDNDHCNGELSEPNMLEETDMLTDTIDALLLGSKDCDPPDLQVTGEIRSLMQEDAPLSSFMLQLNGQAKNPSFDNGVSDWRLKGKRKIRNVGKRLVDAVDIKKFGPDVERSNGSINSTYDVKESALPIEREETSGQSILKPSLYPIKEEFEHAYDESNLMDKDLNQSQLTVYVDEKSLDLVRVDPQLVDVDLKVQPSHQDEHVPLVSLMSKLNGTAIVGYPIQIEILEDGSTNHNSAVIDQATAPQPMWWTARRTAMHRVPRLIPSTSALDEGKDPNLFRHSLHKKACYRYLNHRVRGPTTKFPKKNVKRISLSNRKTRKLSSLASNEKLASDKLTKCDVVLGDSVPRVTCVPVKVVFSRILEAIGRPSSGFARRVRTRSQET